MSRRLGGFALRFATAAMSPARRVSIIGSGNWGSAIAKIIGNNVAQMPEKFVSEVQMYVYEEIVNGRKLTEIINKEHENVKYLPKHKLPTNVVAVADAKETAVNADILVFVIPHQFVQRICKLLKGNIKKGALGISLIKGFDLQEHGGIELISNVIGTELEIQCAVLMGANIANEVAAESFCEATIGCKNKENGLILKEIFQTDYFRLVCVEDTQTVEVCGALKNIVAVGAGFADGLGYGDNTKAAVIRLGFMEIVKFCEVFYQGSCMATFLESCGLADLVTTCYGGRNRKVSEAFAKSGKTIEQLEAEMLNGQKLQGPATAQEVYSLLKSKNMLDRFPMFTAVHQICKGELSVTDFIECLKNHPEHM